MKSLQFVTLSAIALGPQLLACGSSSVIGDPVGVPRGAQVLDARTDAPTTEVLAQDVMSVDADGSATPDVAAPCGAIYQPCCSANTCMGAGLYCNTMDSHCGPCGGPGQRCCASDQCNSGTCSAGVCPRPSCPTPGAPECTVVEVAGGTFTVAENIPGSEQRNIQLSPFAMDATEVTIARFRRFFPSESMPPRLPPLTVQYPGGVFRTEQQVFSPSDPMWRLAPGAAESHPITRVWPNAAQAFCVFEGGRLPTEAEWEFVAYGTRVDGRPTPRLYPWGNQAPSPTCDLAQWNDCPGDNGLPTRRVASFAPTGGFYDLAGNVEEFVADELVPFNDPRCWGGTARINPVCIVLGQTASPTTRAITIRGGDFGNTNPAPELPSAARRRAGSANISSEGTGFRCAYNR
ncbi:MAG: formylglycine-generating enzyme family protein [Deltaproteobacteria bacterium]|nr:formylglycine-generating enzyme family protein [Deltaproteobacteria bacterium]